MTAFHRKVYRLSAIVLASAGFLLVGCGKGERQDPVSDTPEVIDAQSMAAEWSPHPDVLGSRKEFEWKPAEIRGHHGRVMLADLPAYVGNLRGWGGEGASGGEFSMWGGIVPKEHIGDFLTYLRSLGVPTEFMSSDSPVRGVRREGGWTPPDPPATRVIFIYSKICRGSGTTLGLTTAPNEAVSYTFDNPNLPNSRLVLSFSEKTGNLIVIEYLINI